MFKYIFAFIVAGISSAILTPLVIALAYKIGAVDVPEDDRRVHTEPIPRIGGLAIFFAVLISISIFSDLSSQKMFGLIFGSFLIVAGGMVDDVKGLSAKAKLFIQIIAASILYYYGFRIEFFTNVSNINTIVNLGFLSYPITILWVVGITNTINLIDGLDGLAVGISTIAAITLAYVSFSFGRSETLLLSIIVVGANLGFLPYNFNPAKIFMGDTGALFLGFVLSVISIEGVIKSATVIAIFIPILTLGLPIFDTTFAIMRRFANKKPLMEADKGHLHHRLLSLGMNQKKVVLILYLISILLGIGVVLLVNDFVLNTVIIVGIAMFLVYIPIIITSRRKDDE
ncbi:MAG: undecaprenyl/decaprenyl-phosphate alpha-N-acetylglucosaminyl 1-phosphate transferase [Clostridiales bacterium]|nr:undecaprenyl/decaprenyl-phosphate alpha-N-acetylglucosaminyl 1-phosphate transferase [Clostridiales bacterium]